MGLLKNLISRSTAAEFKKIEDRFREIESANQTIEAARLELEETRRDLDRQAEVARELIAHAERFSGHYSVWREKRVTALVSHFGPLWFKDKSVLELGAGYGDIGANLITLGAKVTCTDARSEHIEVLRKRHPSIEAVQVNSEKEWPFDTKFDLIIHMGLLYHLDDVEFSLIRSLESSKYMILETEVCDSDDDEAIIKIDENADEYDQSFCGKASRPSAAYIERVIQNAGCSFERLKDDSCNSSFHIYDWKVGNTGNWCFGLRRLWFIENPNH